ncbi:unnamed protein product [Adineta steineri]|uniref:Uncharacterized protein n=1 Tax=Adineta steineri TaxID=433720 RepID=A0A815EYH5_9BILA|nr:unnamed protein product [Adineta steineri]CAF1318360.1 unnamed protein product [Adineta steineri]
MNNVSSLRIGFISNATFIARLIDQTLSNISCMQCTCTALINSAIAWNCITINNTCQLIKNYSLTDIGIMTNNYGIFFFQQFPFQLTTNQINEETTNPIDMITTTETSMS